MNLELDGKGLEYANMCHGGEGSRVSGIIRQRVYNFNF